MSPEEQDVMQSLSAMGERLQQLLNERQITDPLLIGIHTGGVWLAEHLHQQLGVKEPLGTLDISFYRDDFSRIGMHPQVKPSELPFSIEDRHIVLVDDVVQSGRTIRAAMNEIFDYGRPSSIILAVLVDRDSRELPIEPTITGMRIELDAGQNVKLNGPEPLSLTISSNK